MKLRTLYESVPALREIAALQLPGRLAYAVSKNAHAIDREMKPFQDAREAILAKYSDDGKLTDETAATKELDELLDEPVDFTPHLLPAAILDDVEIKPGLLYPIMWMFDDSTQP